MRCFNKQFAATVIVLTATFCMLAGRGNAMDAQRDILSPISTEKALFVNAQHGIRTSRYSVTGDNEGLVKFGDFKRKVFNHFQMDKGKWVRELFVLNDGKTIGASQIDHTVFWETATGKEVGRVHEHVYGFSHNQKYFIAQDSRYDISIYEYAGFKRVAQFASPARGVCAYLFSPDDNYCAIQFAGNFPAPDSIYPGELQARSNIVRVQVYRLDPVGEVPNFASLNVTSIGTFAADSSAYFGDSPIYKGRDRIDGSWRFDLKTFEVSAVETPKK